ncbi:putative RNA-directed DNA polymerase [Tanacetum coccineum]
MTHAQEEKDPFEFQVQPTQSDKIDGFFDSSSPPKNNQQIGVENLGHEVVYESPNDDTSNPISDEVGNMNNMTEEGGLDPSDQIAAIDSIDEPKIFHQAIEDDRWKEVMRKEIRALEENDPSRVSKEGETKVCRLRKSIYGLKQASQNWYHKFTNALIALDFKQSKADHSFFIYQPKETFVSVLIYVDDVILVGNDVVKMQHTKTELNNRFSIKDIRNLKYFLGIEVARTPEGLVLSQRKYTLDILVDCGFEGCRPSIFPIKQNHKLDKSDAEPKVDASRYRRIPHLDVVHRVLRYLKSTPGQGMLLPRIGGYNLTAYCDSDCLGCPYTRRSRTGYILLLGGSPISWKTKKQSVVSRSFVKAEYRLMASTVIEVLWVRWLLQELNVASTSPTSLFCDNQAARHIANNLVFHERTKHVEMDCFFIRE